MPKMKIFKDKSLGFYIAIGVFVLALISLIVYSVLAVKSSANGLIIASLIIIMLVEAASVLLTVLLPDLSFTRYLPILIPLLGGFAIMTLAGDSVGTFIDFFSGISLLGNASLMPMIVTGVVFMSLMTLAAIIECFFSKVKKTQS